MTKKILYPVLILLVVCSVAILIFFGSQAGPAPEKVPAPGTPVILSGVPDVRQAEHFSCGASSFQAVMNWYGRDAFEADLRMLLNTTPSHGTYPWDMVRVANDLGFAAEWRENLTLADLETSLAQGVPVIIDGQRFRAPNSSWEETWDSGHYMIVIGIDGTDVYLEDPAILGSRLRVPREEFLSLWHDYECDLPPPPDAHKYYRLGVFIHGTPAERWEYVNLTQGYLLIWPGG